MLKVIITIGVAICLITSKPIKINFTYQPLQKSNLESFAQYKEEIKYDTQGASTNICFGSQKECFDLFIDLNSHLTWIPDSENAQDNINKFEVSDSRTAKIKEKDAEYAYSDGRRISGNLVKDTISFENFDISNYIFLSAKISDNFKGEEGRLGLGFGNSKEGFSLMELLKKNNDISHKVFSIVYQKKKKGEISIGEIPSVILEDYKNYGVCDIIESKSSKDIDSHGWNCKLQGIRLGEDHTIDVNSRYTLKFDFTTEKSLFPISYLLKLENEFFSDLIESGDCNFGINPKHEHYTFSCAENSYKNLSGITLLFSEWGLSIPREDIFVYNDEEKEYEFIFYSRDGYEGFVIGSEMMKHFTMVFDESNENVGFYSSNRVIHLNDDKIKPPKTYGDNDKPNPKPKPEPEPEPEPEPKPKEDENEPLVPKPKPKPKPDDNPNINPDGSKKDDSEYRPPYIDNDNKGRDPNDIIIPDEPVGFWGKFFKAIGIILLILIGLFVAWLTFRYYRRKKYSDPSFYYKAADDLFNEGTPLE